MAGAPWESQHCRGLARPGGEGGCPKTPQGLGVGNSSSDKTGHPAALGFWTLEKEGVMVGAEA